MRTFLLSLSLMVAATSAAQSLLPKPQQVVMRKGFFNRNGGVVVRQHLENAVSPEAYRLHITRDSLVISAASDEGFIRAKQTVAQLTTGQKVACCDIYDYPAYRWRGVMLDVSRHFFTIDHLKKQVSILATYKINRLHLHLTDGAGWRMEIKRYPLLTSFAAWRPQARWKDWAENGSRYCSEDSSAAYGGFYTQDQLRDLVSYAAERGVTIVPEIEMPGHSEEVLTAYPELSCTHEPYKQSDFCAGSIATYDFLENVLKEVIDVFPSKYIHVGGDEAAKKSWATCPLCQRKMRELGTDVDGLQAYLIGRVGAWLNAHGRQLVGWDEIIRQDTNSLEPAARSEKDVVMVWRGTEKAHEAIEAGNDVVLSPGKYCYFDQYQDDPHTLPEASGGYLPLEKVYSYVPGEDLPADEKSHVAGLQANVWAEYIPTAEHQEMMLYPRALAIAEIGWNGTAVKDYPEFRQRALWQVSLLRSHGVNAFDLAHERGNRKEALRPVRHKAKDAPVTYNKPFSAQYPASGASTLTDGQMGGWANNDGLWQGFIGDSCFDVTIDLGSAAGHPVAIHEVSTDFMQCCGPWIFYPSSYTVSVSEDGKTFKTLTSQSFESKKTDLTETKLFTWKGTARARFIRVQATPSAFGGWLFADEIIVK